MSEIPLFELPDVPASPTADSPESVKTEPIKIVRPEDYPVYTDTIQTLGESTFWLGHN